MLVLYVDVEHLYVNVNVIFSGCKFALANHFTAELLLTLNLKEKEKKKISELSTKTISKKGAL